MTKQPFVLVLMDGPLAGTFTYRSPPTLQIQPGQWVIVPWGKSRRVGLVTGLKETADGLPLERIRDVEAAHAELPQVPASWLAFIAFASTYYHGPPAELALGSVPKLLRAVPSNRTRRSVTQRLDDFATPQCVEAADPAHNTDPDPITDSGQPQHAPQLNDEQRRAVGALLTPPGEPLRPWLLHGITGSGKTEVYLAWLASVLDRDPAAQVLLLVPEIGLTPALLETLRARFPKESIAVLHSDRPDATRASHWLAAATGKARIVLGTRLAVLAVLPGLAAIVVDEEHDPSYKQQEGVRYSARDLAIARASRHGIPVLLGSATPSLESWHQAGRGRYRLLTLQQRASGARLPAIRMIGLRGTRLRHGLSDVAINAIGDTLERGEQVLIFLNRRGFAPVLTCPACGWLSKCHQCDAFRVLHRAGGGSPQRYRIICHHCASENPAPRACPDCGNQDLAALGRGTQRLEEGLATLYPRARIGRLDRDVARRRGETERFLAAAHAGETDLMVGTQMLAKGHDFRRLTLVVVVDADSGLFAADFRAPERLFATLMQVAGRAGRHAPTPATTLIQTRYPDHPLFHSLMAHDYDGFAKSQLLERKESDLPPFTHHALLLAQARAMETTLAFLQAASNHLLSAKPPIGVSICDPVPMPLAQVRNLARAQLLIESKTRPPLHALLTASRPALDALAAGIRGTIRWQLVVDPIEI